MHHIVLWKWNQPTARSRYSAEHVNTMVRQLDRNMDTPCRIVCVTDDPTDLLCDTVPLWPDHSQMSNASGAHLPSCYRRLKIFDSETLAQMKISRGDKVISMDLDTVVVQSVDPLLHRDYPFVAWAVPGNRHPKVYNGSLFMFTAGEFDWLYHKFDPQRSPVEARAAGFFGSDQAYLSMQLIQNNKSHGVGEWTTEDGVLSYVRDVRANRCLPAHARVVNFHGRAKPWDSDVKEQSPWVEKYWRQ